MSRYPVEDKIADRVTVIRSFDPDTHTLSLSVTGYKWTMDMSLTAATWDAQDEAWQYLHEMSQND